MKNNDLLFLPAGVYFWLGSNLHERKELMELFVLDFWTTRTTGMMSVVDFDCAAFDATGPACFRKAANRASLVKTKLSSKLSSMSHHPSGIQSS